MINVCIVDDEKNIREGIGMLIDWEALSCKVVGLFASGIQALNYIRSNSVDIVVTDIKMPSMDGLELAGILKEERPEITVIILTAYSEFEMARTAIRNGVSDFIVKNEFMDDLPKIIKKHVEIINQRKHFEPDLSNSSDSLTFESIIQRMIANPNFEPSLGMEDDKNSYCLCACEINSYEDSDQTERNPVEMLNNILRITLKNCEYVLCEANEHLAILGISYKNTSSMDTKRIVECLSNMLIMVEEFMRVQIKIGISGEYTSLNESSEYLKRARNALAKIDSKGCLLKVYEDAFHAKSGELIDIDHYIEGICERTFDESSAEAETYFMEFVTMLMESDCSFEQCKLYMLVVYSTLIHKAVRYQLSVEIDFNEYEQNIYKRVHETNTIETLGEIGLSIINYLRNICVGKKNFKNELVERVDNCIKEKYMEDLTLQIISNELYLNSSYVSRAYKKMTGKTVTEAITLYRMAKAKDMLKNTNLKVYTIAEKVGIKDAAYFANLFSKYENISPSDYRQAK